MLTRCQWAVTELSIPYHDNEWGKPVHDDRILFEFLVLEGAQAGLNWEIILKKRQNYRVAFDDFEPKIIANYSEEKMNLLLANPGIIRNQRKIVSVVRNANAFLKIQQEFGSFDAYIWGFTSGKPIVNARKSLQDIPDRTPLSDAVSKDLVRRGFTFFGPTICYAFMQAVGIVNDHIVSCFIFKDLTLNLTP